MPYLLAETGRMGRSHLRVGGELWEERDSDDRL